PLRLGPKHRGAGLLADASDDRLHDQRDFPRGCRAAWFAVRIACLTNMNAEVAIRAEIIAVGSEMLTHKRVDTNSLFITEHLNNLGVEVTAKHVVGDDLERLAGTMRRAMEGAQFVLISGGLGPTEDDLTRDALAMALDRRLVFNAAI